MRAIIAGAMLLMILALALLFPPSVESRPINKVPKPHATKQVAAPIYGEYSYKYAEMLIKELKDASGRNPEPEAGIEIKQRCEALNDELQRLAQLTDDRKRSLWKSPLSLEKAKDVIRDGRNIFRECGCEAA